MNYARHLILMGACLIFLLAPLTLPTQDTEEQEA